MVPLQWSPWVSFDAASFSALPAGPGVYGVRAIGHHALAYIGQTGRDLRARLRDLRRNGLEPSTSSAGSTDGVQPLTRLQKLLDRSSGFEFIGVCGSHLPKRGGGGTVGSPPGAV